MLLIRVMCALLSITNWVIFSYFKCHISYCVCVCVCCFPFYRLCISMLYDKIIINWLWQIFIDLKSYRSNDLFVNRYSIAFLLFAQINNLSAMDSISNDLTAGNFDFIKSSIKTIYGFTLTHSFEINAL